MTAHFSRSQIPRLRLILIYLAVAMPAVIWGAWQATRANNNSPIDWVSADFPARREYDQFRARFGAGDVVVVSWPGCTVDETRLDTLIDVLRRAGDFFDSDGSWLFDRVVSGRETLQFLTHANPEGAAASLPPGILPGPMNDAFPVGVPRPISRQEAIRRLTGTLIGPDGQTTCVVIGFKPQALPQRRQLVGLIRAAIKEYCGISISEQHLAGPVIDGMWADVSSEQALSRFAAPATAVMFILCWVCLRSLRAAVVIMALALFCQGASLALVHFAGQTMTALLIVLPPLIQVLAVAGGIHLTNYYFNALQTTSVEDAPWRAVQMGWLPCVLSSGTTAVGLASLMVSRLEPIRSFGAYGAAGVLLTSGLTLSVLPAMWAFWPILRTGTSDAPNRSTPTTENDGWTWLAEWMGRRHSLVVIGGLLLLVGLGWGIPWVRTSVRIETLFSARSRILRDYAELERSLGPLVPVEVVIQFSPECRWTSRERLELLQRLEGQLARTEDVGAVMSASAFLPDLQPLAALPVSVRDRVISGTLDQSKPRLIAMRMLYEGPDGECWRLSGNVSALAPLDYGQVLDRVRRQLDPMLMDERGVWPQHVSLLYSGTMPVVHAIQGQLVSDLFVSFLGALFVITLVMTVVQGSIGAGLVAMVSNVAPVLLLFGGLGWAQTPMDVGAVMTASVALGIAVDDTLHFLTFFRRGLENGQTRVGAVGYAYAHCGEAMVQTSFACGIGMLTFTLSDFVPAGRFAWMLAALLAIALASDLLLLPALLVGPLGRLFETETDTVAGAAREVVDESPVSQAASYSRSRPHGARKQWAASRD